MRKYVMELIGTFFLTVAITLTNNPIAIGFMFVVLLYIGMHISGGYYNPVTTFAAYLRKRMSMNDMAWYMGAQVFGALLGIWLFSLITNTVYTPDMAPGINVWVAMLMEGLLTMLLCWAWLTMLTTQRFKTSTLYGFVVGLTLMVIVSIGGLFNPAVAFGAMLCNALKEGAFVGRDNVLIYLIAPLVGSAASVRLFQYLNPKEK